MKFVYTIVYVPDVGASLAFFENAFGVSRRFLHDSGMYGELDTGETTLSFAAHALGDMNFPGGHVAAHQSPVGIRDRLGHRRRAGFACEGGGGRRNRDGRTSHEALGTGRLVGALSGWNARRVVHADGRITSGS